MGSEGIQINIPDFDDDDFNSTPLFGRTQNSLWGASAGSGSESPTLLTPVLERGDRSYFHSRGDSVASEDSSHSIQLSSRKIRTPFAHSAQSSVATTTSSPFTKKGSFASLRNAFKSSKSTEVAPPLPPLDQQAYPALTNPFNRSTSSLAHHTSRPSVNASVSVFRPSTPASHEARGRRAPSRSNGHTPAKSQHSNSGSIFHFSDGDSDVGQSFSLSSPPPVPPVPHSFGNFPIIETESIHEMEDQVVMDAKTPSDFALHAIFMRFATSAEALVAEFINQPYDRDPLLETFMGAGVDSKFDGLLQSLGKIAQKHAKSVVESILRWRRSQLEGTELQRSQYSVKAVRALDSTAIVAERKMLTSTYIMCRALVIATKDISKESLGESVGNSLEEMTFEQFRRPDHKMLTSVNHKAIADLYAVLLGNLTEIRFESVTDRFLHELGPIAAGQVPKDSDFKFETLVKGLRYIQIKVWPPERFEEGAEFFEPLSKSFGNAHGNRLKSAFAETLVHMLHPIAKTAQAEVNHPDWAKAIELIYPKAKDMMSKPRYWHVAYPLAVTSLCVAPTDFFLRNWFACFEAGLGKMKERPYRMTILNGIMRLIWTYLYRCHEPASTASQKLENLAKNFFPSNRHTIFPQEERLEPFIYMVHFILSRHIDVGTEICLDLLQAKTVASLSSNSTFNLAPERTAVAAQAILLTLHQFEREEPVPAWPSDPDFTQTPSTSEYPTSSNPLQTPITRAGVQDLIEQSANCLTTLASVCFQSVGRMSVLDDQWSAARLGPVYEEGHNEIIRHHAEGSFAYPQSLVAAISIVQTGFRTWPRLLHSSLPLEDALDMLLRGVIHVEPALGDVASHALLRFLHDKEEVHAILRRFCAVLFDPQSIAMEGTGTRLMTDSARLLDLWYKTLDTWVEHTLSQPVDSFTELQKDTNESLFGDVASGCLFLLSSHKSNIVAIAVKSVRRLGTLLPHIYPSPPTPEASPQPFSIVRALLGDMSPDVYLNGSEDLMDAEELSSLNRWRKLPATDVALQIAESDRTVDRNLWLHIYPAFLQACMEHHPPLIDLLCEKLKVSTSRYHPLIVQLSGVTTRSPVGASQRPGTTPEKEGAKAILDHRFVVHQWHLWLKLLCTTAPVPDMRSASRDHVRARSEANVQRESLNSARDLFKYLSQFLDSDHLIFRETAVSCISCLPSHGYSVLLEDLSTLATRQFFDDTRSKSTSNPSTIGRIRRQERFHTAVARIYFLTAHNLQSQRSSSKQIALTNVLKYVRKMQSFLSMPENRDLFSLQRLRRYFCGTVERLFDGLATLKDSDRFIPPGMHLALYRMCEEWCQLGKQSDVVKKRLFYMQSAAAHSPSGQAEAIQRFQTETKTLSNVAVGAMASLIQKAFFPPDISASPIDRANAEQYESLKASQTLDRLTAILASYNDQVQSYGKKALRSLLAYSSYDTVFADEALRRAFVTARNMSTSNARFFDVVSDVICTTEHGFNFSQVVCLGLSNLCHPLSEIRHRAFNMLETVHEQAAGIISIVQHEAAVGSSAPSTYLHAHRLISDVLSGEHPDQALNVLAQFSGWIPQVFSAQGDQDALILLQSLEFWVPSIDLTSPDKSNLSREGRIAIYHLVTLTLRYAETHAEQIFVMWTRLVDAPYQTNGQAIIRFLLEQSSKVGNPVFAACAAKIVACLSQSVIGRDLFAELCSVIVPARMIPNLDHRLAIPDDEELEMWSDLDILFSNQPRMSLGVAQFSLLFLAETAVERYWEFQDEVPILLHGLFVHLDHKTDFVRERSRHMLFQLLRSHISGYDELLDRSSYSTRSELRKSVAQLQEEFEARAWKDDDLEEQTLSKMKWLVDHIVAMLEPLHPNVAESWGAIAVNWGVECSVRPVALRSLQLFRASMPKWRKNQVAQLLGRISATMSSNDLHLHKFNVDVLMTLTAMASSDDLEAVLPQMFWCAVACLSTTAEEEFSAALTLLTTILDRIDLDDLRTTDLLLSQQPPDWQGHVTLQSSLLTGLRSSSTLDATFRLLQHLAKVKDARLVDPSEGRVRDLYTLALPWCLHALWTDTSTEDLQEFAMNIGYLAEEEERPSITRIMTSFAKSRFRAKDDFLRQSVGVLREHYGAEHWTEVMTLLMGLVLNSERWLRVRTMQILKVLFQQRETRAPMDLLGSELLMPLLRLLETDLATEALDVLEEPLQISGGPSARHVLRMSMHHRMHADVKEVESVAEVFGIAEESGWCVPRAQDLREICRTNLRAVFDSCKVASRPSRIDFQPDEIPLFAQESPDNLGELVQNLHELSSFFKEQRLSSTVPSKQLEARVAAILAKSTEEIPQTPLVDIFDVGSLTPYRDRDSTSGSDTESDLFEFDSPQTAQAQNGFHYAH